MRKRDPVVNVDEPRRRVEMNNVGINRALNVIRSSVSSYRDQVRLVFQGCHVARFSKPGKHMIRIAQAISIISYLLILVDDERHPVKDQ